MNKLPRCRLCRRIPTLRPDGKTYRHGDCPASGVYTVAEWLLVHGPSRDADAYDECRRAMLKLAGVPVAPVTWHKDGHPPQGAEIVFASAHTMGMGVIDADTPPMPPGMWWCYATEARKALGLLEVTR